MLRVMVLTSTLGELMGIRVSSEFPFPESSSICPYIYISPKI